jgi:hypothetical protein
VLKQLLHKRQDGGTTGTCRRLDNRDAVILVGWIVQDIPEVLIFREQDS